MANVPDSQNNIKPSFKHYIKNHKYIKLFTTSYLDIMRNTLSTG